MDALALIGQEQLPLPDAGYGRRADKVRPAPKAKPRKNQARDRELHAALSDPEKVIFLDVETTGLSHHYDSITLVGWLAADTYNVFLPGDDSSRLYAALSGATTLVTFNGTLFDLKFLKKTFADIKLPPIHIDLRYLAKRAQLAGGQKAIEQELGISIRDEVSDVDGSHAVLLWHRYLRGDQFSLRRLIEYNRCDVAAMRLILDETLNRLDIGNDLLSERIRFGTRACEMSGWAKPNASLPASSRLHRQINTYAGLFRGTPAEGSAVVGIDLTGSETRPSGWCVLSNGFAQTDMVSTDEEMVSRILKLRPTLVSIDSPLSLPFGRKDVSDSDPTRDQYGIMRQCERELKRRGINVYPCLLPSMQGLTKRGMELAKRLRDLGISVIESYPGAAQDIIGIPRKGAGQEFLRQGLIDFGISGNFVDCEVKHDELDAITSALVGMFLMSGKYEALSGSGEEALIVPKLNPENSTLVVGISGRINAGKTTSARRLESKGFAYARFSAVIDEVLRERGEALNRENRQRVGQEIHDTKGQRWLCERILDLVGNAKTIVVDGLRFLEDRAFFLERFGGNFLHIHVVASSETRRQRYSREAGKLHLFEAAEEADVEKEVDKLGEISTISILNEASIDALEQNVENAIFEFLNSGRQPCPSPLS